MAGKRKTSTGGKSSGSRNKSAGSASSPVEPNSKTKAGSDFEIIGNKKLREVENAMNTGPSRLAKKKPSTRNPSSREDGPVDPEWLHDMLRKESGSSDEGGDQDDIDVDLD